MPSLAVPDRASRRPRRPCSSRPRPSASSSSARRRPTPSFALTERNAPAVAQICARLDGIPLAIELAAARVRALSVEQIAARLDDRFRLLTGGSRTALPRQQTLRGAVDWSYDLLSEPERTLLRRLAVFAGGCTLEAAEAGRRRSVRERVATTPVADLARPLVALVDKSLVQVEEAGDGERRYRLLETVRQYGQEKLAEHGELAAARDRHRDYFLALAEAGRAAPRPAPDSALRSTALDREHDNLRAALAWCLEQARRRDARCLRRRPRTGATAPRAGLRIAGALWRFWWRRGHFDEGRRWLE